MFTKIMVVVDGDVNIHNMKEVAAYASKHFDPAHDAYFTQGPVDVLDHSCSVMAYGGKIGIDATKKTEEELAGRMKSGDAIPKIDVPELKNSFPEIDINTTLLDLGISIVIISVKKNRRNHVRELAQELFKHTTMKSVKVILFVESNFDVTDVADAVWRFTNNVDPKRDHHVITDNEGFSHIAFDGTRKTKEFDGFQRDWPNILASDEKTIQRVDEIWNKLGLGPLLPSPSVKYRKQLYKGGAVAID